MGLDASELARWTRFAAKGGIGKCTATCDCVAESADDLMFLKDDEITVLLQLPDKENLFLGYCEGVVGNFSGFDVYFHAKLKVPVKAKRASTASGKSPTPLSDAIGQPSSPRSSTSRVEMSLSHSHPAMIPTAHKHIPLPSKRTPESTTPLRINKRTPTSPPTPQFSLNPSQSISKPSPPPSVLDTSYSTYDERPKRHTAGMSDVEVGIGLSLLQDLANEMDSDSDGGDQQLILDQHAPAANTSNIDSYASALSRVGHKRDSLSEGTQESTVEGLGYAQSEADEERELAASGRHAVIDDTPSQTTSGVPTKRASSNPSVYSNSNTSASHNLNAVLPSSNSPISPSFSQSSFSTNDRRPSLVPSAASTSEWEGASDIYDDYRYSRYSMASRMSRFSSAPPSHSRSDSINSPLHTAWNTLLSSAIDGPSIAPPARSGSSDLHTPMTGIVNVDGDVSARAGASLGSTEEERRNGSSDMTTGSFGTRVGIASALRQRLETERQSPTPELTQNQRNSSDRESIIQRDGLGHRIVVEDEEELPSRILDDSETTLMSLTTIMSHEPILDEDEDKNDINEDRGRTEASLRHSFLFSSPEPDLMMLRTHMAPLTVVNRTPSPSTLEDASDEVRGSRGATEVAENKEEEREREEGMGKEAPSPIVPTAPPSNESTPPPPQSPGVLVLQPPLSPTSGATIRTDSPPIDLRPPLALSDIREPGGPLVPGSNQRRSLFLPHPGAPKSLGDGVGGVTATGLAGPGPGVPMYIAAQQQQGGQGSWGRGPGGPPNMMMPPARPNVIGVIRMALTTPPRVAMTQGQGAPQGQGGQGPTGQRSPLITPMRGPTIYGRTETDLASSLVPVPIVFSIDPPHVTAPYHPSFSNPIPPPASPTQGTPAPKPIIPSSPPRSPMQMMSKQQQSEPHHPPSPSLDPSGAEAGTAAVSSSVSNVGPSAGDENVAPAEPKTTGGLIPRPNFFPKLPGLRPRSRSFSGFNSANATVPPQSKDEAATSVKDAKSIKDVKRSLTTSVSSPSSSLTPPSPRPSRLASIQLSPLSLLPNSSILKQPLRSPTSPLAQSVVSAPATVPVSPNPSLGTGSRSQHQLREPSSRSTLSENLAPTRPIPIPESTTGSVNSSPSPSSPPQSHGHRASTQVQPRNDTSSHVSDVDTASINSDTRSQFAVVRQSSVRTKLSLPNLRRNRSRQEDESGGGDSEMLQVKDMEFELVKPEFHFQSNRASDGPLSSSTPASRATTDSESSMDAHRNREIKWMSLMSSSAASQARKSKKVRKLIVDGVPSSVRYLVWSYLTDGKARCVPGVYTQLCSRGRVPSSANIERDIRCCFQDQPHLQNTQGPVLLLLQAYLNMVPDIHYTMGLTLIVGQLLLLAPEEDAFWIFISIMDTHIRPYFSTVTTQMEVDSALFSRALENNDSQVARKILVDMGISPSTICQPWFSSLFVGTLPPEYLNRIWDLFLFDGIPFLLRVALGVVTCCRLAILEATSEETVLQIFRHPQPSLLPPSPDAFLSLVYSVKLKDDDVRKQRIKMEAQVKRQTQTPRTVSTAGGISLPRT